MSVENALNEAQRIIAEMIKGNNPNEEKKTLQVETFFGEMFYLFMERYSKQSKKT